jgi:tRNA(Ile)-lysidine synthase
MLERVKAFITRHNLIDPGDTLVVAVSGGVDSLVLLHVLNALRDELNLTLHAATLDHGIRGAAGAADAAFVRATAAAWGVPVTVERADVPAFAQREGMGLEAAARQVRYTFLEWVAQQIGAAAVATGHTLDDQAETVLMHLIRGSGLDGLAGIPPRRKLGKTHLIRPLLDTSRAEIEAYAAAHDLEPRQDSTNTDTAYLRNRLRHDVIPLLEELNPNIRATLARTADVLREDAAFLDHQNVMSFHDLWQESSDDRIVFGHSQWKRLWLSQKRAVIREAVRRLRPEVENLSYEHVENAIRIAEQGETGKTAMLPGGLHLLVLANERFVIGSPQALHLDAPALKHEITLSAGDLVHQSRHDAWIVTIEPLAPDHDLEIWHADPLAAALAVPRNARLALRTRQPGDRFKPRGMGGHSQKLSDTLINMRVPVVSRDRVPLLTVDGVIAWFVVLTAEGVWGRVAEPFAAEKGGPDTVMVGVCWHRADEA